MKSLDEIKEILAEHKEKLKEKYNVGEIGIFGSYVKGEHKEISDIDILAEFEKPVSLLKLVNMENYLSELLGIKVDLVPKKDIRAELKEIILKETLYI